jgi:Subunit CCDC53 of WASH complex
VDEVNPANSQLPDPVPNVVPLESPATPAVVQEVEQKVEEPPVPEVSSNLIKISESAIYKKFFKMVKFGIPLEAVKLDMTNKFGLDGSLLDNPDLMIERSPEDYEQ